MMLKLNKKWTDEWEFQISKKKKNDDLGLETGKYIGKIFKNWMTEF